MAILTLEGRISNNIIPNLGTVRRGDSVRLILDIDNVDLENSKFKLKTEGVEQSFGFSSFGDKLLVDLSQDFTNLESGIVEMDLEISQLGDKITTNRFYFVLNDVIDSRASNKGSRVVGGECEAVNNIAEINLGKGIYNLDVVVNTIYCSDDIYIQVNGGDWLNTKHYDHVFSVRDIKVRSIKVQGNNNFSGFHWKGVI